MPWLLASRSHRRRERRKARWLTPALAAGAPLAAAKGPTLLVLNSRDDCSGCEKLRREVNELDTAANVRAVDSLINFETVKYFNNERWEHDRYDEQMHKWAIWACSTARSASR